MQASDIRQRKGASSPDQTHHANGVLRKDKGAEQRLKHGIPMQILRTLLLATWFNCCAVTLVTTQLIGSPLYVINKKWYYNYMAMTKQCFGIVLTAMTEWGCPTLVRVSGDKSVRGELSVGKDGRLASGFSERLVLVANHQVYTDWLYLWWFAYTNRMHGHIFIILKESLKYIPIIGQGMMFYGFIFMARKWQSDKPRLQHRLEKLKTMHSGPMSGSQPYDPMWLLIFPEGTNLSINTKKRSAEYGEKNGLPVFNHVILPRTTGLFFCLQQLKGTVDWVYDCTVGYEGPPKDSLPDKYLTLRSTYLQGRPPKSVCMHWRRFSVSEIPLDDQKEFEAWLLARWAEKDQLLEEFFETGRFPTDLEGSISCDSTDEDQKAAAAHGYVETDVKLGHWSEVGQIFMVLVGIALLLKIPKLLSTGA
ncbi:acyltransferase, putative [Paecilomyces variotii No. 5]|uniref:Acyltransferase, putative n=1 Tax=Byssochlamys spectabilis (strain No. 5 / NBRC 109023) TaxID=1356009 RepID=V5G7H4_BYSSN|nr:acyltransferase, putative [Paecilomyces variotii No. 5]